MSKVAVYLNGHLSGEVVTSNVALSAVERDGGVLVRRPEMVARVANTSDIRKIMRFCSQLAEKGHVLPVSVRGHGTDLNGAATGTGVVIDMTAYMQQVKGIDPKQQLIHVQAGMSHRAVNAVLATHRGMALPAISGGQDGTIGGAMGAGAAAGSLGRTQLFADAVQQLEVVLSNGDVLQTGRLTKRDVAKKKGLTTLEGDIYRQLDNLIDDNAELIQQMAARQAVDTAGFAGITKVKRLDGSIDLTPLFIGAQGALGVISEVILKAEFISPDVTIVAAAFDDISLAQAAADAAADCRAAHITVLDGRLAARAAESGKQVAWAPKESFKGGSMIAIFADFSERSRARAVKKLQKKLAGSAPLVIEQYDMETADTCSMLSLLRFSTQPSKPHAAPLPTLSGLWMPLERIDTFLGELRQIEANTGVALPVVYDAVNGFVDILPVFDAHKVSDRRAMLQVTAEVARAAAELKVSFAGRGGDGRLKAAIMRSTMPEEEAALYDQIRQIFDPAGILAPGIKRAVPAKELAAELNEWCRGV